MGFKVRIFSIPRYSHCRVIVVYHSKKRRTSSDKMEGALATWMCRYKYRFAMLQSTPKTDVIEPYGKPLAPARRSFRVGHKRSCNGTLWIKHDVLPPVHSACTTMGNLPSQLASYLSISLFTHGYQSLVHPKPNVVAQSNEGWDNRTSTPPRHCPRIGHGTLHRKQRSCPQTSRVQENNSGLWRPEQGVQSSLWD